MSTVTNMILTFDCREDEDEAVAQVEDFGSVNLHLNKAYRIAGRALTVPIFYGAVNCLELDVLVQHLRRVNWLHPENVRLFVCKPDEYAFESVPV